MHSFALALAALFFASSAQAGSPNPRPSANPASKVIPGHRVSGKLQVGPQALVLKPPKPKESPKPPAYFDFSYQGAKLILSFKTHDPNLELASKGPLVIQILPQSAFKVNPSLITSKNWPKANWMEIKVIGAARKQKQSLGAGFYYEYCNRKTRACKKVNTSQAFDFES